MKLLSPKLVAAGAMLVLGVGVAVPALAQGSRGRETFEGTSPHGVVREVVYAVLTESGLEPGRLDEKRADRLVKGMVKMVERGIIAERSVTELRSLAGNGELGKTISQRAKAKADERKSEADERKATARERRDGAKENGNADQGSTGASGRAGGAENGGAGAGRTRTNGHGTAGASAAAPGRDSSPPSGG